MQKYFLFSFLIAFVLLTACDGVGNYQGESAQYWYQEYDACDSNATDLQNQLDDAENNIEDLKSCISYSSYLYESFDCTYQY